VEESQRHDEAETVALLGTVKLLRENNAALQIENAQLKQQQRQTAWLLSSTATLSAQYKALQAEMTQLKLENKYLTEQTATLAALHAAGFMIVHEGGDTAEGSVPSKRQPVGTPSNSWGPYNPEQQPQDQLRLVEVRL